MRRGLLIALTVALMAAFGYSQEPIKIGINLELSGRMAVTGNDTLLGMQVAREQQPELLGRTVEFSICDNASSVDGSVACANRFVDEGVVAVLGTYASSHAIPAAAILQDAGTVSMATGATNPAVTQAGDYAFRIPYVDSFQGEMSALYAYNEAGARRVAVFRQQDDDFSVGLANFFIEEFEAMGGETLALDYTANTVDFSAQINDMRSFNADFVNMTGFCAETASAVVQMRQQGFTAEIHGGAGTDDSQCPDGGGPAFDGFTFISFAEPGVLSGDAAERASAFRDAFLVDNTVDHFTGFTLSGADAYKVVWQAVTDAGSTDRAAVRDALAALQDFPGVTGSITYVGTDGTPENRVMGLFAFQFDESGNWEKAIISGISR